MRESSEKKLPPETVSPDFVIKIDNETERHLGEFGVSLEGSAVIFNSHTGGIVKFDFSKNPVEDSTIIFTNPNYTEEATAEDAGIELKIRKEQPEVLELWCYRKDGSHYGYEFYQGGEKYDVLRK